MRCFARRRGSGTAPSAFVYGLETSPSVPRHTLFSVKVIYPIIYTYITELELTKIYDLHFKRLYQFFYYKVLNQNLAEDLTGDVFLQFVAEIKKGKMVRDPEKYLYGIAYHIFYAHLRRKYKQGIQLSMDDFQEHVSQELSNIESSSDFTEVAKLYIAKLSTPHRTVLSLRLIDRLPLNEIAERLGKSLNYVKVTQRRALKQLRKLQACTPLSTINLNEDDKSN